MTQDQGQKKNKKYFQAIILFLILAVIFVAGYFAWQYFQQPASGQIRQLENQENATSEEITFERYEGEHFSFRHKMSYVLRESEKKPDANNIFLEKAFFSDNAVNAKKIVMQVENLSGRTIDDSANYNLRQKYPKRFKEEVFAYGEIKGKYFLDTESDLFEKTFFIKKENYLIELSFLAPKGAEEEFGSEIEDILKSVQFKI